MKVCPICNETFADELKFCDLDGTRLKREVGTQSPEKQNKAWSLIGVGLLVGALVLSALSIIFLPKARVAPTVANSETGQVASTRPDSTQTEIAQAGSADSESPEILVEEIPATELKKKDAAQSLINGNSNSTAPDPKAAAKESDEDDLPAGQLESPVAPPPPLRETEPAPAVKPVSDARDGEAAAKPVASAEMKRDPKRDSSKSKDDDDDKKSDKKGDEKKKKKGGGLFGAFKKIFGKD